MHMRTKKWARPELAACPWFTAKGVSRRNAWRQRFAEPDRPLHVELGCGKGVSSAQMVAEHPEINYVLADLSADVLGDARRNVVRICGEQVANVQILQTDICRIEDLYSFLQSLDGAPQACQAAADASEAADAVPRLSGGGRGNLVQNGRRYAV